MPSDQSFSVPRRDDAGIVAELRENRVGVLAERRHGAHRRRDTAHLDRRQQRTKRSRRRVDLAPALLARSAADARRSRRSSRAGRWRCPPASSRATTSSALRRVEHSSNHLIECRSMPHAIAIRLEAFVIRQLRAPKHLATETRPLAPVLNREVNRTALARLVRTVRRD